MATSKRVKKEIKSFFEECVCKHCYNSTFATPDCVQRLRTGTNGRRDRYDFWHNSGGIEK